MEGGCGERQIERYSWGVYICVSWLLCGSGSDAATALLRQSCGQQILYVLRGVLLVEVLRRIAQRVQQTLALAGRLVLQQLHAALHLWNDINDFDEIEFFEIKIICLEY